MSGADDVTRVPRATPAVALAPLGLDAAATMLEDAPPSVVPSVTADEASATASVLPPGDDALPVPAPVPVSPVQRLLARFRGDRIGAALARGAIWSMGINAMGLVVGLGVQVALARALGPQEYGLYAVVLAAMNAVLLFSRFEFDTATVRFVGAYAGGEEWGLLRGFLRRSRRLVLGSTMLVGLVAAAIIAFVPGLVPADSRAAYLAACMLLPATGMLLMNGAALQGLHRVPQAQGPNMLVRPLLFGAGVLATAWWITRPVPAAAAIAINTGATIVALLVAQRFLARAIPSPTHEATPEYRTRYWFRTAGGLLSISAAQLVLSQQADVLVVGTMVSQLQAGIYGVASQLASLIGFAVTAVVFVALPMISDLHARGDRERLVRLLRLVCLVTTAIGVPAAIVVALGGRFALGLYGPTFTAGYGVLCVLLVGQGINSAFGLLAGFVLTMTGHERQAAVISTCMAFVNLGLTLLLTPRYGIEGTAMATMLAAVIKAFVFLIAVRHWVGINMVALRGPAGATS